MFNNKNQLMITFLGKVLEHFHELRTAAIRMAMMRALLAI